MLFHTTGNHLQEILDESRRKTILLDFYASWCAPCRILEPLLDRMTDRYELMMTAYSINADTDPEMLERFDIRVLPTVLLLRDGKEFQRFDGEVTEESVFTWLETYCKIQ